VLTFEQIKELIELVGRHGLAGVELERAGFRLKIAGLPATPPAAAPGAATPYVLAVPHGAELAATAGAAASAGGAAPGGALAQNAGGPGAPGSPADEVQRHILNSPIVGTFYRSPSPEMPPFVEIGTPVRRGQVVCIIEAMKLMNEIESDVDGTIGQIYPQNAQAVAFGEPLFAIVET
jgi:acetyl-CoA carboxylase biotin carboxyl carrier protein